MKPAQAQLILGKMDFVHLAPVNQSHTALWVWHHHHLLFVSLQTTWTARRQQRSAPHPRQPRLWSRWPRAPGVKVMSWSVYNDNSCLRPTVCSFCGCRNFWWKYTDAADTGNQSETLNPRDKLSRWLLPWSQLVLLSRCFPSTSSLRDLCIVIRCKSAIFKRNAEAL